MGIPSCPQPHPTPSITWFLSENNTCLRQSPIISKPVLGYYRAGCWKWRKGEKFQVSPVDRLAYKQDADSITLSLFPWLVTTTCCSSAKPPSPWSEGKTPSFHHSVVFKITLSYGVPPTSMKAPQGSYLPADSPSSGVTVTRPWGHHVPTNLLLLRGRTSPQVPLSRTWRWGQLALPREGSQWRPWLVWPALDCLGLP